MRRYLITLAILLTLPIALHASTRQDSDLDGVSDEDELNVYHTDINSADTDDDGFSDWVELNNGFSPWDKGAVTLEKSDFDGDGLSLLGPRAASGQAERAGVYSVGG